MKPPFQSGLSFIHRPLTSLTQSLLCLPGTLAFFPSTYQYHAPYSRFMWEKVKLPQIAAETKGLKDSCQGLSPSSQLFLRPPLLPCLSSCLTVQFFLGFHEPINSPFYLNLFEVGFPIFKSNIIRQVVRGRVRTRSQIWLLIYSFADNFLLLQNLLLSPRGKALCWASNSFLFPVTKCWEQNWHWIKG